MFLCVLESSGEGTHLVCVVEEAAAVSWRNAAHVASRTGRRAAAFQNKLEAGERKEGGREGEWRMSGKVMIMKNFKASLLFASSLACASYEALYK